MPTRPSSMVWVWRGALACFLLAGLTGVLYRLGLTYGVTAGLDLTSVRHAHSHLMYFGWVTPALFALIARQVARRTHRPAGRGLSWIVGGSFAAALVSYPLFLAFGYTPVALGQARVPLAVIASTLNMFAWYAFVGYYRRATRGLVRDRVLLFWDAALSFLVLATLGAFALALLKPLGVHDPAWQAALTHVFLDFFSEGWFVLAVLGLAYAALQPHPKADAPWSLVLLCAGLPVTFALGMPAVLVPPALGVLARVGAVLVAAGLLANVRVLWRAGGGRMHWLWRVPLALLALKALAQLGAGAVPGVWWGSLHGARLLYLHLMLLGFVTLGLTAAATYAWGNRATASRAWLYAAVLAVLASLVPLAEFWPATWQGRWAYVTATWVAPLPILAAAVMLLHSRACDPFRRARAATVQLVIAMLPPSARPTRRAARRPRPQPANPVAWESVTDR